MMASEYSSTTTTDPTMRTGLGGKPGEYGGITSPIGTTDQPKPGYEEYYAPSKPSLATTGGFTSGMPAVYTGESVALQIVSWMRNAAVWIWSTGSSTAQWVVQPVLNTASYYGNIAFDTIKLYLAQYPALRTFFYVFGAMTAIPLGIFMTYATVTLGICLAVAGTGVFLVEGFLLGLGLLGLVPILIASFFATSFVVGAYYLTYWTLSFLSSSIEQGQQMRVLPRGPITEMTKSGLSTTAEGIRGTKELLVS